MFIVVSFNAFDVALMFFLHFRLVINEPLVVSWTALWGTILRYIDSTWHDLNKLPQEGPLKKKILYGWCVALRPQKP